MPKPSTPIWATKSSGFDGVVDIRPFKILSSYEPTMDACNSGELSVVEEGRLFRVVGGVCGGMTCDEGVVVNDLRG